MKQINKGFYIGSFLSVVGFMILGWFYLHFDSSNASQEVLNNVNALPSWCNFGVIGLDMRPAWTCMIGIILCVALNKVTEYFTGTEFSPVHGIKRACETGHGTAIIE